MAFKRYIHKHGKKLGPYYYENVRDQDGKVKTVYLGTNPSHHPKHKIRKPLFFLILVLILILILGGALFLLQNKAYLIKKVRLQEPDFDIDQILLKVLVRSREFIEKQVRVMNTGDEPAAIDVEVRGLADIIKIDSPSFVIKPGQTKVVALNFTSFVAEQKIEQHPGVYVGKLIVKSHKAAKEIPIVVEIETKNVLFDMNLNPVAIERKVKQGSDATIEVRLFNLESIESVNVDVEYFVKDMNGNTIITESETVVVKTQASFFKTISVPKNLKPGPYVFAAIARFGTSIGTSSYLFEVIGPEAEASFVQFCKNSVLCLGLSFTTILLLFVLTAYFYFFVGAYLYEKITGVVALPRKRKKAEFEEEAEEERAGIFESIKNKTKAKLAEWRRKREREKAEKEKLEREKELQKLAEERKAELEAKKKQIEEERKKLEEQRKQELLKKQKEIEARQKEEEQKRKKLERKKIRQERKKKIKKFFHKIGLYKTPEEKKQITLQKEDERQERLRREVEIKQRKEIEQRQKEHQRLAEEKRKEELRKQREIEKQRALEELRKQKELEAKKRAEERQRKRLERERLRRERKKNVKEFLRKIGLYKTPEEKRQKEQQRLAEEKRKEELRKQREIEKQRALEELRKNKETAEQLNAELRKLESEKKTLSSSINQIESKANTFDKEILSKSKQSEELNQQKNLLFEKYQKQLEGLSKKQSAEKSAREAKTNELKAKLTAKQNAWIKELEAELSKLSPDKRKATEKWKRLELKAKLKMEEQSIEEEIKKLSATPVYEKKGIEDNYKKALEEINKKQQEIKQSISNLEIQKQQVLLEKKNVPRDLQNKDNEIQKIRLKLENITKEKEQLNAKLSKLKSELRLKFDFFKKFISNYKERAEKARKGREEKKARLEAKKRRKGEELRRQKEQEETLRKIEEERKRKEEEKRAEEEQKRIEREETLRQKEAKKKQKELEKQKVEEEKKEKIEKEIEEKPIPEKKPNIFEKLFGKAERKEVKEKFKEEFEVIKEEKAKEVKKPKTEAEEFEEAIRGLDLFRQVAKEGKIEPKEKPKLLEKFIKKEEIEKGLAEKPKEGIFRKLFTKEAKKVKSEKKPSAFGLFKKEEKKPTIGVKEKAKEIKVEKPSIFSRLFKVKKKEKPEEKPFVFEEVEEKKPKERKEKPAKILKSKKLGKFYKILNEAKDAITKNNTPKARKLYIDARKLYVALDYDEKKEVYNELMELYRKLR